MPIIINEFSVISEPPGPTRGETTSAGQAPEPQRAGPAMTPKEFERILKFATERWLRLLAD